MTESDEPSEHELSEHELPERDVPEHQLPADELPERQLPNDGPTDVGVSYGEMVDAEMADGEMVDGEMVDAEMVDALGRAFPSAPGHLDELRRRLAMSANVEGILDLAYRTVDSPVGPLLLVATDVGLVRVAFAIEDHDVVLADLAQRISPRVLQAPTRLEAVARALDEYFAGSRLVFDVDLDWRLSSGFRSTVLHRLPEIAYGTTASYATVAALADNPKAVRAVGSACATNPLPVVIPCHRVVRSDGAPGGYLGGMEAKRTLLDLEARKS